MHVSTVGVKSINTGGANSTKTSSGHLALGGIMGFDHCVIIVGHKKTKVRKEQSLWIVKLETASLETAVKNQPEVKESAREENIDL